jgi:hypothetical protein
MSELEMKKLEVDIMEIMANIKKMGAETANLAAETARLNKQTFWYPLTLAIAFVAAIGTIVKLLF